MLNKVKKIIIPMLDTLGEAIIYLFALDAPNAQLLNDIAAYIDAINSAVMAESEKAIILAKELKDELQSFNSAKVELIFSEYVNAINEIEVQYKVVFLPYYDNTWDSLASVYEAFVKDSQFVTEIVIIPIRRNTPQGWKMVYKDYLTEKGIPNTPYHNYNVEADKPDVIFYNNPYDGVNIEQFQSQNLKPYAGRMVYIPYYLYRYAFFDKKEDILASLKISTELPGHDNADVIVVQGKSFLRRFQKRSKNGSKMVMLGNPKTDNIYKNMQNWLHYNEWDKITKGKAVFFLNTHYSLILTSWWKRMMPDLLSYFTDNDDVLLFWRPHPQTFLMANPDSDEEGQVAWRKCLEIADRCGRIIFDRTESAISAMMYCDAVISQNSSIIAEAICMNKPVFALEFAANELLSKERRKDYFTPEYFEKVKKLRKFDAKNLYLLDVVCHFGLDVAITGDLERYDYLMLLPLYSFFESIKKDVDSKRELRELYRNQLFVNLDGNCGEKILEYTKTKLIEEV